MASTSKTNGLFRSLQIGQHRLSNRIVMAPLTRCRSDDDHVPIVQLMKTHYSDRACYPGTLLISEATNISHQAAGMFNTPGIWSENQVTAWTEIVKGVHEAGGTIFCQLWAVGRAASATVKAQNKTGDVVSSSDVAIDEKNYPRPRPLTEEEIWAYVRDYADAAKNAIRAGFDGVEIHAANGYLIDQFTQEVCNTRTDEWGGSIEKQCRFALEVAKAVVDAVGAERTAIRLSPWSVFQGMRVGDPVSLFSYLISQLQRLKLAYLHLVEPRIAGATASDPVSSSDSNQPFVEIWNASPVLLAGGYDGQMAGEDVERWRQKNKEVAIVFGRWFISNPDLAYRLKEGIPLTKYNRKTFYIRKSPEGYNDYPFAKEARPSL